MERAGVKMRNRDKPTDEFWKRAREFVGWCSPEELRLLRIMAGTEMEKRLKGWDEKLAISESEAKAKKSKAIRRNVERCAK
jgi:hypothetical protein